MALSQNNYIFLAFILRNAQNLFMWGFLYFAVFNYLIKNGHFKTPWTKNDSRRTLYYCSWMITLWITTILFLMGLSMRPG